MNTVIQVVQHLRPGGIETMVLDLLSFCEQGNRTFIVSLEGTKHSAINHWPKLQPVADKLVFLGKKPGLAPSLILSMSKLFKRLEADVVHTHHIGPLLYAGVAARLAGVRQLIHTEHDAWHLDDPRRRILERVAIRLARPRLVADAETVAGNMRKHLKTARIQVIPNGIDTQRFIPGDQAQARQRLGLPQGVLLIGCSGRLEKVKGQRVLIDALTRLPEHIHLTLAGTGSNETQLRRQAEAFRLGKRVHFLGRIDEMPTFYHALDVFCLPSLNEGLPLSPLEAQACNIRTLVTDVGGSRETLCPHSGQLVPGGDASAMASTLDRMLRKPLAITPREFVQQRHDVRRMASAYTSLLHAGG